MGLRGLILGCLSLALAAPASAQIIATSIPREDTGGGTGSNAEHRFALHLMASPFAKWKINSYTEDPRGNPTFQQAATTDSSSKFIGAAEAAFAAGSNWSIGVGGWYNELGTADIDLFELDLNSDIPAIAGTATSKLRVMEVHGNVFYKDLGVQVGLVNTRSRLTGLKAGAERLRFDQFGDLVFETLRSDITLDGETVSTNNMDAFLVYKRGGSTGSRGSWGLSFGGGIYRDSDAGTTKPSAFATASVGLFRGLGIDASYWYVGGAKPTVAQQDLADLLEDAVSDNMSRFTIGIGYTFN